MKSSTLKLCLAMFLVGCSPKNSTLLPSDVTHRASDLGITLQDLKAWDAIVQNLLRKSPLKRVGDADLLYTYLYTSQKAFADASFQLTTAYSGSIDPISLQVVQLFYPDYENPNIKEDPFSKELTATLMKGVKARYEKEQKALQPIQLSEKEGHWASDTPPDEQHIPNAEPWAMKSADEFQTPKPPPPDDPYWKDQLKEMKEQSENVTPVQKQKSYFWARMQDPDAPDFKTIAQNYMDKQDTPFELQMEVRAKLAMALMDAMIAVFHDKFIYMVKRPNMQDPEVKTLFKTPNHPSYPSAHSTMYSAGATVLCYYFPENHEEWNRLSDEASMSRIWARIHFPVDYSVGEEQGRKIGKAVLFRPGTATCL